MFLEFEKWHGCRNDFIVTWLNPHSEVEFDSLRRQAPRLCSRVGDGIGADGIMVLHRSTPQDLLPRGLSVINADGSLAKVCGNGIRCAALSVLTRNQREGKVFEIPEAHEFDLSGHIVTCRFVSRQEIKADTRSLPLVAVEMGIPQLNKDCPIFAPAREEVKRLVPQLKGEWHVCRIANDHLIFLLDDSASLEVIHEWGPKLQKSEHWDGINVHVAMASDMSEKLRNQIANELGEPVEELYDVIPWERGVGLTQACGSGACAVTAAILSTGLVESSNWIGISMPGGRLYCKQEDLEDSITLAGPGEFVFRGTVEI